MGAGTGGGLTLVSILPIGTIIVFLDNLLGKSVVFRVGVAIYFLSVGATLFSEKLNKPFSWWYVESPPIRSRICFSTNVKFNGCSGKKSRRANDNKKLAGLSPYDAI